MKRGHGEKLSRKREAALAALLTEPTILAAASRAGIHERTLRLRLADPAFAEAFRAASSDVMSATISRLKCLTDQAVNALAANLNSESPTLQLRAAELVMSHCVRLVELLDLSKRVAELEAAVTATTTQPVGVNGEARYPTPQA
jgi:hypothetical protein